MSSDQPGHSLDPDEVGWLSQLRFNEQGLLAAIAQDYQSGRVLMLAWMNEASLRESFDTGYACYWSRPITGISRIEAFTKRSLVHPGKHEHSTALIILGYRSEQALFVEAQLA